MPISLTVYPAEGQTVYDEDGDVVPTAGLVITLSGYYLALIRAGDLLTYNPLTSVVETAETLAGSQSLALLATNLTTRVGVFDKAVVHLEGHTTSLDGGGGPVVWIEGSATAADGGTVFGTTGEGRWKRPNASVVTPQMFGAKGDGTTDDHAALVAAFAASDRIHFPEGTYICSPATSVLTKSSRSGIHITADQGAVLKIKNSTTTAGYVEILKLYNCTDVLVEDLIFDGNTANRTGHGGGANNIFVEGGARIRFARCTFKNSALDGFYMRARSVADESTYPTDISLIDCDALDNCRNGVSLIGGKRIWIRGGRFYNTQLGDPGCGIDIEPNASDTYSVEDVLIEGGVYENNTGEGILVTAANAAVRPKRVTITNIRGRNNTKGLVHFGYAESCTLDGAIVADDTTAFSNAGIILISTRAFRCKVRNVEFRNVTGTTGAFNTKYLVYCDDSNQGNSVQGIDAYNCSCNVFGTSGDCEVRDIKMNTITAGDHGIYLGPGIQTLCGVRADNVSGRTIQSGATFAHISDVVINEPSATIPPIRITGGVNVLRDISVYESGNAPGAPYTPIFFDSGATIHALENVFCYAAGTPYTGASAITLPTSVSGARIRNVHPNPFLATATWDPASLASGASVTSSSITVTGAVLGDHVDTSHSVDLQGLTSTGYVSAANTVKVVLTNLTGGAVDLASHTVTVEVRK